MVRKGLILLTIALLAGCSGATTEETTEGTDAGPSTDAGGPAKLQLEELAGVWGLKLVDNPTAAQSAVTGEVRVVRGGTFVKTAKVTLNGVDMKLNASEDGFLIPKATAVPGVGPGQTLTVEATDNGETARLAFKCADAVTLTKPVAGSTVAAGTVLHAEWTGPISYANATKPHLIVYDYNPTTNLTYIGQVKQSLQGTETSADVTLPQDADLSGAGFLVTLTVYGPVTEGDAGKLSCGLVRQVAINR